MCFRPSTYKAYTLSDKPKEDKYNRVRSIDGPKFKQIVDNCKHLAPLDHRMSFTSLLARACHGSRIYSLSSTMFTAKAVHKVICVHPDAMTQLLARPPATMALLYDAFHKFRPRK